MSTAEPFNPAAHGWEPQEGFPFVDLMGPIWRKREGGKLLFGLLIEPKHGNRRDVAHGGVIAALFDTALGMVGQGDWERAVTTTLDVQFIGPAAMGEFIVADCAVVTRTRSLAFVRGVITAGDKICATAHGTWKRIRVAG